MLCGAALICLAVDHEHLWSGASPLWLPVPGAVLVMTVTIVFWQALRYELPGDLPTAGHANHFHRTTLVDATLVAGVVRAMMFALLIFACQQSRRRLRQVEQGTEALRASQTRFRAIFDQTFQFIGLMSTDGKLLEANRTALAFAGIAEADVINKPFWETPWWTHCPQLQQKVRDAVLRASLGEFVRFEATHPDHNGDLHVVDFSLKPVYDEHGRVVLLIPEGRDITDQKRAEEELTRLARLDRLTGLPNRALLFDRLNRVLARSQQLQQHDYAFLFLDFDGFKLVNDTLGHDAGDALLKGIAERLSDELGFASSVHSEVVGHTAARLGGDEFVVLLDGSQCAAEAIEVADRLLATLSLPFQIDGHKIRSTVSIGIVLGNPGYERAEELIRDADSAMYAAKRAGKARHMLFDVAMRNGFRRRRPCEETNVELECPQFALA
jgi:diguanylate cyclase (GGDEF)-like protein/PAS domain S-box-containing protein